MRRLAARVTAGATDSEVAAVGAEVIPFPSADERVKREVRQLCTALNRRFRGAE